MPAVFCGYFTAALQKIQLSNRLSTCLHTWHAHVGTISLPYFTISMALNNELLLKFILAVQIYLCTYLQKFKRDKYNFNDLFVLLITRFYIISFKVVATFLVFNFWLRLEFVSQLNNIDSWS
jgi:hypothetical protein